MFENNLTKFEIPLNLGNVFKDVDKGRIDKAYKKIWEASNQIAQIEALEFFGESIYIEDTATSQLEKFREYKRERRDFHQDKMSQLLHSYISSKSQ